IVLLVQKEVAERVCAKPGEMSILSVMAQYYGEPKIIARVPSSAFWPVPKVDSAILKIIVKKRCPVENEKKLFRIVKAGFSHRRKTLKNNLKSFKKEGEIVKILENAGLKDKVRAQELTISKWLELVV
ncbi:MAG: rRNA adenine dimethyltransferase family protein, partial [Patescibacteria group bacterium]